MKTSWICKDYIPLEKEINIFISYFISSFPMHKSSLSQIVLLQGYYKFLSLAMFFDHRIKTDSSLIVEDAIRIPTGDTTAVYLNVAMTKKILADIHKNPEKKNIFGYLATISGLRGIFSCMKDFMQQDAQFEKFLHTLLGDQFSAFQKIIFFCRNVLSHHITADIVLTREDYEKQMLMLQHTKKLCLNINYKTVFGSVWKGKENYGFEIDIDTKHIKEGQKYTDCISWHEQWMLAELCYNFSEYYKARKLSVAKAVAKKATTKPVAKTHTRRYSKRPRRKTV